MKVALVHEFLTQMGGAERVLKDFLEIWPDTTLHVLVYNPEKTEGLFEPYKKKVSFINSLPMAQKDHKWYLGLMPRAVRSFDFSDYDVIFSDSSSFAKGVNKKNKLHICYCHTPTRFLWTETEDYLKSQKYPGIVKATAKPLLKILKNWDYRAAQKVDYFIANSRNVQERIKKYYNRDSVVIYPPVDMEFFKPAGNKQDYFFTASRLEPYKKIDIVIEAFNELGWPLKIAGSGTKASELQKKAKSNIEFLGRVSDEKLHKLYAEAKAFIFPAEEDAGIMMLEAQASGTPVIAYGKGGALELVKEGVSGEFFYQQTKEAITEKLKSFNSEKYSTESTRNNALQFNKGIFKQKIREYVEGKYQEHSK